MTEFNERRRSIQADKLTGRQKAIRRLGLYMVVRNVQSSTSVLHVVDILHAVKSLQS